MRRRCHTCAPSANFLSGDQVQVHVAVNDHVQVEGPERERGRDVVVDVNGDLNAVGDLPLDAS